MQIRNFPFTMQDVCRLINLKIYRSAAHSIYVECPVCDKKKRDKFNINFDKEVFQCSRCGVSGGMLDLYILFENPCLDRKETYKEIIRRLSIGSVQNESLENKKHFPASLATTARKESITKADIKETDITYRKLLSLLKLSEFHRHKLNERGLTNEQILKFGFRSTPDNISWCKFSGIFKTYQTIGVPGFYTENGLTKIKIAPYCKGILIPAIGIDGYIHALQIRLDKPFEGGAKYIWLSSSGKENGCSSGSPICFCGNPFDKVVYLTEGGLKAITSHCLSRKTFLGNQGANQISTAKNALQQLKENGTQTIVIAYDNDKYENIAVNKGYARIIETTKELGFNVKLISWDKNFKGIDDFLLASRKKRIDKQIVG